MKYYLIDWTLSLNNNDIAGYSVFSEDEYLELFDIAKKLVTINCYIEDEETEEAGWTENNYPILDKLTNGITEIDENSFECFIRVFGNSNIGICPEKWLNQVEC